MSKNILKIKPKNVVGHPDYFCAAYFKNGEWRIYDRNFAMYKLRSEKSKAELISEVASEKRVSLKNIKIVKLVNFVCKEV